MKWSQESREALARVPILVRKRVKGRVEEEARRCGAEEVGIEHMVSCKKRFLERMEEEVRGFQLETCFSSGRCPNHTLADDGLPGRVEELLKKRDMRSFLKGRVQGPLKLHHEFRVSISCCPNACSRPQIVDIGLIGARRPRLSLAPCSRCGACIDACREKAVSLGKEGPLLDSQRCLGCGQCIQVCSTGTIEASRSGYRILVGGKLGRHPQLGRELPDIYGVDETLRIIEKCLEHYQANCIQGERFGEILARTGFSSIRREHSEPA